MNGGSSASYVARTPCIPLFRISFKRGGNRRAFFDYQGRAGIISIVRWNLRIVIFGVDFFCSLSGNLRLRGFGCTAWKTAKAGNGEQWKSKWKTIPSWTGAKNSQKRDFRGSFPFLLLFCPWGCSHLVFNTSSHFRLVAVLHLIPAQLA